ncbi:MAG: 30S ribosomal protein S8 [Desulfobacterales bacterium]|nr:30S ribosomal protein S8 [Desulfobacterales bacterium]
MEGRQAGDPADLPEIRRPGQAASFSDLQRVSKPGRRIYVQEQEISSRCSNGMGIAILSTSQGRDDRQAGRASRTSAARSSAPSGRRRRIRSAREQIMSRIGKKPIPIPAERQGRRTGTDRSTVEGPKGKLSRQLHPAVDLRIEDGTVDGQLRHGRAEHSRALHGLTRTLVANMVDGRDARASSGCWRSTASATGPS